MSRLENLEHSHQDIPRTPEVLPELAESGPLHQLSHFSAVQTESFNIRDVYYPFSNDESAAYFDQVQSRIFTPDFRQASNRTALLIGESSLMAALPYIVEDTIIIVDEAPEMGQYMKRYISALREAPTANEWAQLMGFMGISYGSPEAEAVIKLEQQIKEWRYAGYKHPIIDQPTYERARAIAQEKAIIPWTADITAARDMYQLAKVLKAYDATITLMNLTNVLPTNTGVIYDAARLAVILEQLPVAANVPILTTSRKFKDYSDHQRLAIMEATGPLFGLANLREHGGKLYGHEAGSAAARQYIREPEEESKDLEREEIIETLLRGLDSILLSHLRHRAASSQNKARALDSLVILRPDGTSEIISTDELPDDLQTVLEALNNL